MRQILTGFGFLSGASYPFRTFGIFWRNPRLFSYIIVPILLNFSLGIFLYSTLLFLGWQGKEVLNKNLTQSLAALVANLPSWLGFLDNLLLGIGELLELLLAVLLFILTGFVLVQFGAILGAPWYGKLSEQLERLRLGQLSIIEIGFLRDIGRAILFEIKKLVLVIVVGLPLLLLNFFPGIGTLISTLGGIFLTSTIICLDFLDAPLERRRLAFREKLRAIFHSLPASAGFALICLVLISIPLLNLLTIPLCVAAGTLFSCDRILTNSESGFTGLKD
jgi:CysZ protein